MSKIILGLLVLGGAALAEEKPPVELEQLKYFSSSSISASQGWQGDKWSWATDGSGATGKSYKSHVVVTRKSATELDTASDISAGGPSIPFREAHCKKEK